MNLFNYFILLWNALKFLIIVNGQRMISQVSIFNHKECYLGEFILMSLFHLKSKRNTTIPTQKKKKMLYIIVHKSNKLKMNSSIPASK